jgi:hypothetical protein
MPTLFTLTIDTEEEWDWEGAFPTRDLAVENVRHLPKLQALCRRHGVAATYFTNQAVLDDPQARPILLEVARQDRVEIGMHIHPWNTPPFDLAAPVRTRDTFLHNLPPDLIRAKLESVYRQFADNGLRPTSFRGGRYSSGQVVQDFLRDKGFLADASVVPYTTWADDGAPDHRHRDLSPVRLPPRRPGEQALWEIPLTMGFTRRPFRFWQGFRDLSERTWLGKLRLVGLAERLGVVRKAWLNFEQALGKNMLPFLAMLRRLNLPAICFTLHSSSLLAGKNRYTPTQADEDRLFAYLDEVLGTVSTWPEFRSATVTEVALTLEESYHAGAGN